MRTIPIEENEITEYQIKRGGKIKRYKNGALVLKSFLKVNKYCVYRTGSVDGRV